MYILPLDPAALLLCAYLTLQHRCALVDSLCPSTATAADEDMADTAHVLYHSSNKMFVAPTMHMLQLNVLQVARVLYCGIARFFCRKPLQANAYFLFVLSFLYHTPIYTGRSHAAVEMA